MQSKGQHLQYRANFDTTSSSLCLTGNLQLEITQPDVTNTKIFVYFNTVLVGSTTGLSISLERDVFASESGGVLDYILEGTANSVNRSVYSSKSLDPIPIGIAEPSRIICPGQTIRLSNIITSAGPNFTFNWSNGQSGTSILVNTPGIYTITVTNTSVVNCFSKKSVTVTGVPKPIVTAPARQVRCFESPLPLTALHAETKSNYTYAWSPPGYTSSTSVLNPNYTSLIPQVMQLVVTDGNGCKDSVSINVRINPPLNAGIPYSDTTVCKYNTVTLITTASGGTIFNNTAPYTYTWTPSRGLSDSTISNPVATPLEFSGLTYTFTVKDSNSCTVTDSVHVKLHQLAMQIKDKGQKDTVCASQNLSLKAEVSIGQSPYTFAWSPSASFLSNNADSVRTFGIATNTILYVQVTDRIGCTDKDSLEVFVEALPEPNIGTPNKNICTNSTLVIDATPLSGGTYSYNWFPRDNLSNSTIAGPRFSPQSSGTISTYTVTVTSLNNARRCRGTASVSLRSVEPPAVDAAFENPNADKLITDSIRFVARDPQPGVVYSWTAPGISSSVFGAPSAAFLFPTVGDYKVFLIATNTFGCVSKDSLSFRVTRFSSGIFYVPNVFSPAASNDENKVFKFYAEDGEIDEDSFLLRIYNVNGDMVFESRSFQEMRTTGWDGGKYTSGVYTWVVQGRFANEKNLKTGGRLTGSVTLLR